MMLKHCKYAGYTASAPEGNTRLGKHRRGSFGQACSAISICSSAAKSRSILYGTWCSKKIDLQPGPLWQDCHIPDSAVVLSRWHRRRHHPLGSNWTEMRCWPAVRRRQLSDVLPARAGWLGQPLVEQGWNAIFQIMNRTLLQAILTVLCQKRGGALRVLLSTLAETSNG